MDKREREVTRMLGFIIGFLLAVIILMPFAAYARPSPEEIPHDGLTCQPVMTCFDSHATLYFITWNTAMVEKKSIPTLSLSQIRKVINTR